MRRKIFTTLAISFGLAFNVYSQYAGYDLSNIVVTPGANNPVSGIIPVDENKLTADSTFDIVNWNVSWMGAPQMNNNKYGDRQAQISGIAEKLVGMNADVYALQEVVVDSNNGDALKDLLTKMNSISGKNNYSGVVSPYHSMYWQNDDPEFPSQCLAYIWNNQTVTVNNDSALLYNESSRNDFAYGRLPFLLDANVKIKGKTQRYMLVNIHLKAKSGYKEERATAMAMLKQLLKVNFSKNNVVLLGDFNVADGTGAVGEITSWGMYADDDGNGICDYVHAAGNKTNGIEHLLVSNELFDELAYSPEYFRNMAISGTGGKLSDHYAFMTRLYLYEESGNFDPEKNPLFPTGNVFTMSKADYQTIVDYVKNNPELAALDPSTYNDSEYYFGASSYYTNFDIRNGKHYAGFKSWQDAVRAGISLALLPSKFPNAELSTTFLYEVTFKTYSGTNGSETFKFKCTKSAPNPEFEFTYGADSRELAFNDVVKVFPNPVSDQLNIRSLDEMARILVFNLNGQMVISNNLEGHFSTSNVSFLKPGIYLLKVIMKAGSVHQSIIVKK